VRSALVVGNPKPASRTLQIATSLAGRLNAIFDTDELVSVDLADFAEGIFTWPNDELDEVASDVASADVLIVASPIYKGTYTGLLKSFLDRYPSDGLAGVTAIPVMTGGSPLHGLAPEMGLRSLLVELGASVPTQSLFFLMSQLDELDDILDAWIIRNINANAGILGALARTGVPT
jgi:FMN reductase